MFASLLAVILLTAFSPAHGATSRGTPDEAKTLLAKAVEHFQSAGRATALADFTAGKAPYRDRDLYVVCVDNKPNHAAAANGGFPRLVGTSADVIHTADGRPVGKALWDAAAKSPTGSLRYEWLNPSTYKVEWKVTFYQKVADDLLCGVGAYSPE